MSSRSETNSDHQDGHKNTMNTSSLEIKEEDKFFSRLLSKESSKADSRRLYYAGRPGSVPFLWESQPGTPKTTAFHDDQRPPLTPPPSYFSGNNKIEKLNHDHHNHDQPDHHFKRSRSTNLLSSIFPKKFNVINYSPVKLKPDQLLPFSQPNSSESSSMLDHRCFGSPSMAFRARSVSWFSSSSSTTSFDSRGYEEDEVGDGSPKSTLCFGCYRR